MLDITVVQPSYFAGENPDEKIAQFLIEQLDSVKPGGLIVLPEYSNAGGVSDVESELNALPRAEKMLKEASRVAKEKGAYVARSSFSMNDDEHGGCSMIVAPDGQILKDMGKDVGSVSIEIDPSFKYMRTAGFGGDTVRNDDFISVGLCPDAF